MRDVTRNDDLTTLGPVELLRAIQGLLLNNSSDDVRGILELQAVDVYDAAIPRHDTSFSMTDLLESPFFIAKNLKEHPHPVPMNASNHRLSGTVSQTAQAVLKDFYNYNVAFDVMGWL
jgi:hypothetical protein